MYVAKQESTEKTEHFLAAYDGSRDWNIRVDNFWTLPSTMQVGSWYAGLQPTYNKSNDDESSALAILAQKTPETQSPICLDVLKLDKNNTMHFAQRVLWHWQNI